MESNYKIPIKILVDFEDKNYLVGRDKKRKGYLFYWLDKNSEWDFDDIDNMPVIRLPIKEKYWSFRSAIGSFIEALSNYYAWLLNYDMNSFMPDDEEIDEV